MSRQMAVKLCAAVLIASQFIGSEALARYRRPDVEKVPVARLVANLTKLTKAHPKDANAWFNLARVHAMAFALKTDTAEVRQGPGRPGSVFRL